MKVGLIVLTWNAADIAVECLKTVMEQQRSPDYLLVVDNASSDGTADQIARAFPDVRLIRNARNLGFSGGMNVGIQTLQDLPKPPDIVALLNQDTLLDPPWLGAITAPFESKPQIGAVGSKIRYPNGTIQHAGAYLKRPRAEVQHIGWHEPDTGQYDDSRPYDLVTGAAIALSMQALHTVGLFDTGYAPAYFDDVDLCWRLTRHNYHIRYEPQATLVHYESLSIRDDVTRLSYNNRARLRFVLKSYELADILGPFAEAELAFLQTEGNRIQERALRWAYLQTLIRLPEVLETRSVFHPPLSAEETRELTHLLLRLKHAVKLSAYRRVHTTLDQCFDLTEEQQSAEPSEPSEPPEPADNPPEQVTTPPGQVDEPGHSAEPPPPPPASSSSSSSLVLPASFLPDRVPFFRPGTYDLDTMIGVMPPYNEYRVPDSFNPEDVVVDVGAHIGSFSYLCLKRGAGYVATYEADRGNYDLVVQNLRVFDPARYEVHHAAVWRSDVEGQTLFHCGYSEGGENTGGGNVFDSTGSPVPAIPFDAIIRSLLNRTDRIRLVKVDCEGSEYPILYTSRMLHAIEEIAMEVHYPCPWQESLPGLSNTVACMKAFMRDQGFEVEQHEIDPGKCYIFLCKQKQLQ